MSEALDNAKAALRKSADRAHYGTERSIEEARVLAEVANAWIRIAELEDRRGSEEAWLTAYRNNNG